MGIDLKKADCEALDVLLQKYKDQVPYFVSDIPKDSEYHFNILCESGLFRKFDDGHYFSPTTTGINKRRSGGFMNDFNLEVKRQELQAEKEEAIKEKEKTQMALAQNQLKITEAQLVDIETRLRTKFEADFTTAEKNREQMTTIWIAIGISFVLLITTIVTLGMQLAGYI